MTRRPPRGVPFPWFGTKKRWDNIVWERLGDPNVYCEPFAGSAALLFRRPTPPREREIIMDLCGHVSNFWRAVKYAPDEVAAHLRFPASHLDKAARHRWLIRWHRDSVDRLVADPDWYDVKAAGWWCWGICLWIGGGWCVEPLSEKTLGQRPYPHSAHQFYTDRDGTDRRNPEEFLRWFSWRLQRVWTCSGNWKSALTDDMLGKHVLPGATCGIVIDPPYIEDKSMKFYSTSGSNEPAIESWQWALKNGHRYRIAYFANRDDFPCPDGWTYETMPRPQTNGNCDGVDICYFSPACLSQAQHTLF